MRLLVLFGIAALSYAQELDWKPIEHLAAKASDSVDVHLDGSLLKLAAGFLSGDKADEAQVRKLVAGLTGVYVKSYEFNKAGEFTSADVEAIRSQVKPPAWSRVLSAKSQKDGENTEVYLRAAANDQVGGLVIITSEAKQLTFVQVTGTIRLSDLGSLSAIPGVPEFSKDGRVKKEENE